MPPRRHLCWGLRSSLLVVLLFGFLSLCATFAQVAPSEGTIGTEVSVTGSGFGKKRGAILIQGTKLKVTFWSDSLVKGTLASAKFPPGTYDVSVTTKGAAPVVFASAFSLRGPAVAAVTPSSGLPNDVVEVVGGFFGPKKPTVYLQNSQPADGKNYKMKVLQLVPGTNGGMDKVVVAIPKKIPNGVYDLSIANRVGSDTHENALTIGETATESYGILVNGTVPINGTTSSSPLPVLGKVIDFQGNSFPASLSWLRSSGGNSNSGQFSVTVDGSWSGEIPLLAGDNSITLSIPGEQASRGFNVTYNNGYAFSGSLQMDPDVAYLGEITTITARVNLADLDTDPQDVKLVMTGAQGETEVGFMSDDGDLFGGDEIEGDDIFTLQFELNLAQVTSADFRVVVGLLGSNGSARSEIAEILVEERLTDEQIQAVISTQEQLQSQLDGVDPNDVEGKVNDILGQLQGDPKVVQAGKSGSGRGAWAVFDSGIAGVVYSPADDVKSGGSSGLAEVVSSPDPVVQVDPAVGYQGHRRIANRELSSKDLHGATDSKNLVASAKAFAIAAQYFDWGEADDIPKIVEKLEQDSCFSVDYLTYNSSGSGSVEDFKNLGDYGLVVVSSHGDSFYNGILSLWQDRFGWDGFFGQVVVHSNMRVTPENMKTYESDLKKGRLVVWGTHYGMTPSFFTKYSGTLPNSLVYMSICRGTWNSSLANAFIGKGAGSFLGYSDYVAVSFCVDKGTSMFDQLLMAGKDLSDAFVPGQVETDSDPAEFILFGANDLSLEVDGLQDGGLESGQINQAWETDGDARIITGLGASNPTEGGYMAIISTGLGFSTSSGALSQTLCLGQQDTLKFEWNFFSEEWLEFVGSEYQDEFTVWLAPADDPSNKTILLSRNIDDLAGEVSAVSNSFDQGGVYATGWRNASLTIPEALKGTSVILGFAVTDVGDSIYDSAVLIDGVELEEPAP